MNIAAALKAEISRVARKEQRAETQTLKKSSSQYRSDIANLKRRVASLERSLKQLSKASGARKESAVPKTVQRATFSREGFAKHRARLGLTAAEMGSILGVSGQSVYLWESGRSTPRPSQLASIRNVQKLGKRAAAALIRSA